MKLYFIYNKIINTFFCIRTMRNQEELLLSEEKEFFIKKNFNEIAQFYDQFNDAFTFRMHRSWKKKLLKLLNIKNSKNLIDLCCGSGDIAIYAALNSKNPDFYITACDFSEEMLKIMDQRIHKLGLNKKITIKQYNVLNLPSEYTSSFEIATVGYGIRNVKDRIQFFKETYRILKENGKLGILEVGDIKPDFLKPLAHFFMKRIIPLIGWIIHKKKHKMYEYLPSSALVFPPPETIVEELKSVGFSNVIYKRLFFGASIIYIASKKEEK